MTNRLGSGPGPGERVIDASELNDGKALEKAPPHPRSHRA